MDLSNFIDRWFALITVVLSLLLAVLFGAIQAGLI